MSQFDLIEGSTGDDNLVGTNSTEHLHGLDGNDLIDGKGGNDFIFAGTGADTVFGGSGTDFIDSGEGNDTIDGGADVDYGIYNLPAQSVEIIITGTTMKVAVSRQDGTSETDIYVNTERLMFSKALIACDVGANGTAGKVYRLYQAAFGREPDSAGVGYWIAAADRGLELHEIAAYFMQSPEFIALYGASLSNSDFVRMLYVKALHRQPDEAGVAFWTNMLDIGDATRTEVLAGFSESVENQAAVATVIGNGFQYTHWH